MQLVTATTLVLQPADYANTLGGPGAEEESAEEEGEATASEQEPASDHDGLIPDPFWRKGYLEG